MRFLYYRNHFLYRAVRFVFRREILWGFRLQPKLEKLWGNEGRCDSMGVPLYLSLSDLKGYSLWVEGTAQFEKIDYLAEALQTKNGPIAFIDCGANYGEFLALLNKNNQINHWTAFEPNPNVNTKLEKTLADLKQSSKFSKIRFDLEKKAVIPSGEMESIQLHFNPSYSGGGSLLPEFNKGNSQSLAVSTISIPQMFSNLFSVGKPAVVVIKIDVEGFEFQLLPAFIQELKTRKADYLILFETHLKNVEMRNQLHSLLRETSGQKVVYPQKHSSLDLRGNDIPFTQYDIAIASWPLL